MAAATSDEKHHTERSLDLSTLSSCPFEISRFFLDFLFSPLIQEKCDRAVELCLKYDERARLAEYQYYRSDEAEELEQTGAVDIELAALNAKLRGGGDVLHRVCAVASFASTGSKRCHEHILDQFETQNAGMSVVKKALEEFAALLDDGLQKNQLSGYLAAL